MSILRTASVSDLKRHHSIPAHISDSASFLVHDGDLHVQGAIELDWNCGWETGAIIDRLAASMGTPDSRPTNSPAAAKVCGLMVNGNLRISGALVNASPDSGATLIVHGDLAARQASCGGAYIDISGDAHIDDVLYAHYNDGELHVGGSLFAKALINDDHLVLIAGGPQRQPQNKLQIIDLRELHDGDDDERLPKALKKVVGNAAMTRTSVLEALRKCEPTSSLGKPQTPQAWKSVIWKDPKAIRKLPKPLRTEETYLLLLAQDCTLAEPEIHELVSQIPSNMLSERVRMAAFLLSPKSLLRLPAEFDLHSEYARCLAALSNPESYLAKVPTQFLPR